MKLFERFIVSVECTTNDPTLRVYLTRATATSSTREELLATNDSGQAHALRQGKYQELQDAGVIDEDGWIQED